MCPYSFHLVSRYLLSVSLESLSHLIHFLLPVLTCPYHLLIMVFLFLLLLYHAFIFLMIIKHWIFHLILFPFFCNSCLGLVFWNSIHLEVASDSFCLLCNCSWLLVFILLVFYMIFSGFNLYCWKGIHFS